ncbi:pro-resilin [Daphnia magna]|uniref:Cuticular protein 50Ca n=2 Tax=Daphnia magna TaxID=35525 RepID=A0A0P5GFP5_9CRUS|nr:pro-resilin [Daphnia magna]KZS00102.1 Cuticular protein 50Ca [Daphnia magna]
MSLTMLTLVAVVLMAFVSPSFSYSDTYSNTPSYSYAYQILDTYSGQDFGHEEAGKQGKVNGEYRVLLPDDRLQVVSYSADQNGYVADVQYADGSTSPAYGRGNANGYSGSDGYASGAASVKTSSYFNPPTSNGGYGGGSAANGYGAGNFNNYQNGGGLAGQGVYQQAFKSGCVCQCPA